MKVFLHHSWQIPDLPDLHREPLNTGSGRGVVSLIRHPRGLLVERQYRHGGARRRVFPRSFPRGGKRPDHEYRIHRRVFEAGISTVEPVGWSETAASLPGLRYYYFYSGYEPGAIPLPKFIREGRLRPGHLRQMATILKQLFDLNIFHTDLNLNNWLVRDDRVYLIDFDKARETEMDAETYLTACLLRLLRSVKKLGFLQKRRHMLRFLVYAASRFEVSVENAIKSIPKQFFTERFWDKCRWMISGGFQGKS
ncbi:MAG: lipopolysaccharide kinase InaA family protein [Acidobacteriota bacterium]|nr:lipopolysaccharide kinase InaA family protein [Acidobacteriota bacterium]